MISLTDFLDASPTAFHATDALVAALDSAGWIALNEKDSWKLKTGMGYYTVRGNRSVVAFVAGGEDPAVIGLHMAASHLDSPAWKLKTEGIKREAGAWRLPVEVYGGPIFRTWLDRELEIAGRISFIDGSGTLRSSNWRSGGATAIIPSLAVHLDRTVNDGLALNPQTDMAALMPLSEADEAFAENESYNPLFSRIASDLNILPEDILSNELFLIPSASANLIGSGRTAWIASSRLDNLAMAHAMLASLLNPSDVGKRGIMAMWFDAEEIGSRTDTGAASIFPDEVIERFVLACGGDRQALLRCRRSSLLLSADMAHSIHPNFKEKNDSAYPVVMGGGPAIKNHGLKHYATDVHTEAAVQSYARNVDVKMQKLLFRSDIPCGYSLGPLASSVASIPTADVGNPLWAMHSSRETASMADHDEMILLMREHWTD